MHESLEFVGRLNHLRSQVLLSQDVSRLFRSDPAATLRQYGLDFRMSSDSEQIISRRACSLNVVKGSHRMVIEKNAHRAHRLVHEALVMCPTLRLPHHRYPIPAKITSVSRSYRVTTRFHSRRPSQCWANRYEPAMVTRPENLPAPGPGDSLFSFSLMA